MKCFRLQSGHDKRTRKLESRAKKISPSMESAKDESPVLQFLRLEWHNALRLVQTVHSGLAGLSRACRGTQLVTASLHQLADSLLRGETPKIWLDQWPDGSLEAATFLRDLVRKSSAVQVLMYAECSFVSFTIYIYMLVNSVGKFHVFLVAESLTSARSPQLLFVMSL